MGLILAGKFNSTIASNNFESMLTENNIPFVRKAEDLGLLVHPSFTGGVKIYISHEDWEKFLQLCKEIDAKPEEFAGPDTAETISSEEVTRTSKIARILTWIAVLSFFGIIFINMTGLQEQLRLIVSIVCGVVMGGCEFAAHVIRGKEYSKF